MERKTPKTLSDILPAYLRQMGLETPLLEYRLMAAWDGIVGERIAKATVSKEIRNQKLVVRLSLPAARSELMMKRTELVRQLNNAVKSIIIYDIQIL